MLDATTLYQAAVIRAFVFNLPVASDLEVTSCRMIDYTTVMHLRNLLTTCRSPILSQWHAVIVSRRVTCEGTRNPGRISLLLILSLWLKLEVLLCLWLRR